MSERCSYELDPETVDVDLQFPADELDNNGNWICPHEAEDELCIFHKPLNEKSSTDVQRELLEKLRTAKNAEHNQRPQFVGIQIEELDFSSQIVGSIGVPVDLRNGHIGSLSIKRSIVNSDLNLRGCKITDSLTADRATFEGDVDMVGVQGDRITGEGAQFKARLLIESVSVSTINFEQAAFEGVITGDLLEVGGETSFEDAEFHDVTDFKQSEFLGEFNARNATFRRRVDFSETLFGARTDLSKVTFEQDIFLSMALFERQVSFDNATFEQQFTLDMVTLRDTVSFDSATFTEGAQMLQTAFEHDMSFVDATFDGAVSFAESTFNNTVDFQDAVMLDRADFGGVRFDGEADFENTTFRDVLYFSPAAGSDPANGRINLRQATIQDGTLSLPEDGKMVYDLEEATLGKITVATGDASKPLEYYRLVNVTYDGFDFAKGIHRDAFQASNWNLHRTVFDDNAGSGQIFGNLPRRFGVFVKGTEALEPGVLESTYLKAKNGANDVGDSIAASEFFQREKLFRRWKHRQDASNDGFTRLKRLNAALSWGENFGFSLVSGYGERPLRVVASSLFLIFVFSLIYNFIVKGPFVEAGFIEHLLFSFQSFITFILGTPTEAAAFDVQFLSSIQGFLGAFFIALFVFTLTRSIDR